MRLSILFFFALIFVEVWSIIAVGHRLGALATFGLLLAGFIFGSQLIRYQGMQAMMNSLRQASGVESPLLPMMDALLKSFAGILFIIPGFVSDAFALLLLIPFIRRVFARYLMTRGIFKAFGSTGFQAGFGGFNPFGGAANDSFNRGNIYDHEGSAEVSHGAEVVKQVKNQPKSAEIIDLKPESKDSPQK